MTAAKMGVKSSRARRLAKVEAPLCVSFLEQAEVCREQARDAARLKRFRAALGLFRTALNLCRHAEKTGESDDTRLLAAERITQIDVEFAAYAEFARSADGRR